LSLQPSYTFLLAVAVLKSVRSLYLFGWKSFVNSQTKQWSPESTADAKPCLWSRWTDSFIFLLNICNGHWITIVADLELCKFSCYNSAYGKICYNRALIRTLNWQGNALNTNYRKPVLRNHGQSRGILMSTLLRRFNANNCPKRCIIQSNTYDCGVHDIGNAT